jgi:GNAT superfamily N-acetyltransferase
VADVTIRIAADDDLPALVESLGSAYFFSDRLPRQSRGLGDLLVAWEDGVPVGDVYLWREAPYEDKVRRRLPDVPTITLEVRPDRQNRGIGSALMREVERCAVRAGAARVSLGVGVDNPDARRLYERLGYVEWEHGLVDIAWQSPGPDGVMVDRHQTCHWMVKDLRM